MNFNLKEIFTAFMVLFAVIDIVGNIPIIIDLRKKVGHCWIYYDYIPFFR
jgi:multiple antibiotic resistance protein